MKYFWKKCPKCGNEHFIKVSKETRIYKFPAYCKKCKNETMITIEPKQLILNELIEMALFILLWRISVTAAHRSP